MRNLLLLLLFSLIVYACSASETQKEDESDIYVFDDVTTVDTPEPEEPPVKEVVEEEIKYDYILQLGAFSTKERAEKFVNDNRTETKYPMMIVYDAALNYHLVQLPVFQERDNADRVLRDLLLKEAFKDAFVKPIPEMN